jgi:hypothetical protein
MYSGPWNIAVLKPRVASQKIDALRTAKASSLNWKADCHRLERTHECNPCYRGWQSALHLRAVCQGVNTVVANRRIGPQSLAIYVLKLYSSPRYYTIHVKCSDILP